MNLSNNSLVNLPEAICNLAKLEHLDVGGQPELASDAQMMMGGFWR